MQIENSATYEVTCNTGFSISSSSTIWHAALTETSIRPLLAKVSTRYFWKHAWAVERHTVDCLESWTITIIYKLGPWNRKQITFSANTYPKPTIAEGIATSDAATVNSQESYAVACIPGHTISGSSTMTCDRSVILYLNFIRVTHSIIIAY